jgi:hypothetical protein
VLCLALLGQFLTLVGISLTSIRVALRCPLRRPSTFHSRSPRCHRLPAIERACHVLRGPGRRLGSGLRPGWRERYWLPTFFRPAPGPGSAVSVGFQGWSCCCACQRPNKSGRRSAVRCCCCSKRQRAMAPWSPLRSTAGTSSSRKLAGRV